MWLRGFFFHLRFHVFSSFLFFSLSFLFHIHSFRCYSLCIRHGCFLFPLSCKLVWFVVHPFAFLTHNDVGAHNWQKRPIPAAPCTTFSHPPAIFSHSPPYYSPILPYYSSIPLHFSLPFPCTIHPSPYAILPFPCILDPPPL